MPPFYTAMEKRKELFYTAWMREAIVERHFTVTVKALGGISYKFVSPGTSGVADQIACLPDGSTWFVEIKKPKGSRTAPLQHLFAADMARLKQHYTRLYTTEAIDQWAINQQRNID